MERKQTYHALSWECVQRVVFPLEKVSFQKKLAHLKVQLRKSKLSMIVDVIDIVVLSCMKSVAQLRELNAELTPGVIIEPHEGREEPGTLGGWVKAKDETFIVTNDHVLELKPNQQPGLAVLHPSKKLEKARLEQERKTLQSNSEKEKFAAISKSQLEINAQKALVKSFEIC